MKFVAYQFEKFSLWGCCFVVRGTSCVNESVLSGISPKNRLTLQISFCLINCKKRTVRMPKVGFAHVFTRFAFTSITFLCCLHVQNERPLTRFSVGSERFNINFR